jgi:hypothetical protein
LSHGASLDDLIGQCEGAKIYSGVHFEHELPNLYNDAEQNIVIELKDVGRPGLLIGKDQRWL